jgi:IS605 OrfB family transposase
MDIRATAKIKIIATPEIIETLRIYAKGLQLCINIAWQNKIMNNIKLHPFVYKTLRSYGLQSQLAIACIKQSCGMVKKAKSKPIINRCSMRYNLTRSFSFKNNIISLATIKGRIKIPFTIPNCYKEYFSWKVCESLLRIDKKGRCFFLFTFSKDVNIKSSDVQNRVLGIDLGVNNLAVTSDCQFYNSAKVKQIKRKFKYLRSILQAKGTRSSKRLLKKLSGRETRWMAWINHNISKDIASSFDGNKIVMEDLKGIRKQKRGKRMNYWISNWSFNQLQSFIQYKAERTGIIVDRVKPHYTSQICHRCGKLGTRSFGCFSCSHCGLSNFNADLNASRNLSHPKLAERQVAITQPHSLCNDSLFDSNIVDEHKAKYHCL